MAFSDLMMSKGLRIDTVFIDYQIRECQRIMTECNDVSNLPNMSKSHSLLTERYFYTEITFKIL